MADKKKGKGGGKGGQGKKKSPDDAPSVTEIILKKTLKLYDFYCNESNVKPCPDVIRAIKQCLEEDKDLNKIIVRPIEKDLKAEEKFKAALLQAKEDNDLKKIKELKASYSNTPPPVTLEPLMRALKEVQFSTCKELYIIDLPLFFTDVVQLTHFLKLSTNPIKKVEISDCLLQPDSIARFSSVFNTKRFLNSVLLDYNEFGDRGCLELCRGLENNQSLVSLSLNYCKLTSKSGDHLGRILCTTALAELYLDGNDLGCVGAYNLIVGIVEECEREIIRKELEEKARLEEEEQRLREEASKPAWEREQEPEQEKPKEKKKKKKKKKKSKEYEPPPVGPFVCKLHLADNCIDIYENGGDQMKSLQIMHETIAMFCRLIKLSKEIEEIDLHNNTIGNMSAKMILHALNIRKETKVGPLGIRVSEQIDKDLFDALLKIGKKVKKKKGKKKKK